MSTANIQKEEIQLPPVVFILGGPGSGKGTQCEKLLNAAEKQLIPGLPNKIHHVNVGGILRNAQSEYRRQQAANAVTPAMAKAGPVLEEMLASGQILPSWVTVMLMKEEFKAIAQGVAEQREKQPDYSAGILVDGFPRSLENLGSFEELMGPARRLIEITCDDNAMIKRVLARGAAVGGREDDQSVETIQKRLNVFHGQTHDVLAQYTLVHSVDEALAKASDKRIGIVVNGDRPVEEVANDFTAAYVTLFSKL